MISRGGFDLKQRVTSLLGHTHGITLVASDNVLVQMLQNLVTSFQGFLTYICDASLRPLTNLINPPYMPCPSSLLLILAPL